MASRLGLRSSDIRRLQFDNLDWDNSIIRFEQYKTKRFIELPMLAEVGDAIIDYLLHGRPKSNSKTVFLTVTHPFRDISSGAITDIVARHICQSRVNVGKRHHGSHCLRHSLATAMMNEGTALPVISESLGHSSTESTMYYLGVNVKELLLCSRDVPPVPKSFYEQKGGVFYE